MLFQQVKDLLLASFKWPLSAGNGVKSAEKLENECGEYSLFSSQTCYI